MPSNSPESKDYQVVSFSILVDGSEIPQGFGVVSIFVSREINRVPYAKIKLADGGVSEADGFEISDSDTFLPGKEVVIKAGYDSRDSEIFKGIITNHNIKVDQRGSYLLIECRHPAIKMTVGRKNRLFTKKQDSQIISSILGEYSLSQGVDSTKATHEQVVQYHSLDWDFVLMRAEINGLVVMPTLDKLSIKKPENSSPALDLTYGYDLIEFNAGIDSRKQLKKVKCSAWDPEKQEVIEATGNPPSVTVPGDLTPDKMAKVLGLEEFEMQSPGNYVSDVLDDWATARLSKAAYSFLEGSVKFPGNADVNPGDTISISGLSKRINGDVFVGGLTHLIENNEWTTEAHLGISEEWFSQETPHISSLPSSGLAPALQGLTIGIVIQIHEDPAGSFRVQVEIPILQSTEKVWARLSTFYASNGFGAYFMPEINDEVVLGFLNQDPQNPIILGSMYNKKLKSPYQPDQKNTYKAIKTKSDLLLEFEDVKKIITIQTPAGNKAVLDDDQQLIQLIDQHNNEITMDSSGITIKTDKDINLVAQQNIKATASQDVGIEATSNLDAKGMQVSLKGDTKLTAEGGAQAEFKAGGSLTVKGAIVQIN